MLKKISIALLLVFSLTIFVTAQEGVDDQGNPNNPDENQRANACYDGGSMETKSGFPSSYGIAKLNRHI